MKHENYISFSTVKYDQLIKVVGLTSGKITSIFDEWFSFPYSFTTSELELFTELIDKHRDVLSSYTESELIVQFIGPIINKVDFVSGGKRAWFERPLSAIINGVEIGGTVDFMVATGVNDPQKPYFFIQEFKRAKHASLPKEQLLAELIVAMELNQTKLMRGAYIIGQNWNFVVVEKIDTHQFRYHVSQTFDALWLDDLKQIYICLQAVKQIYCND